MERDGTGQLSLVYTYGNQRLNAENYNNLTGIYTYDGRGSVSAVIGGYGDFRASYWYDGLGNVKSQVHGYGVFGSGKKYYGYNAEQYNPVTGNQNLRNRQVNIRRQRFLTEDTYLGQLTDVLSINRYAYAESNPLKYKDPSGNDVLNNTNIDGHAVTKGIIKSLTNGIRNIRKNVVDNENYHIRQIAEVSKSIVDFISNTFVYQNINKPLMQYGNDRLFEGLGSITGGGKGVAQGFTYLGENYLNEYLFDKLEPYANYIQECSDMFAEDTYRILDYWTNLAGGFAGFKTIKDSIGNKIVTTNYWTFQGAGGYTTFYDSVFHKFTESDHDRIKIGNEYTIWIWKGDYLNLGAGGEIGIYNGVDDIVGTTMSDKLGVNISMQITTNDGKMIVDLNNSEKYISTRNWNHTSMPSEITKKEYHWWLTGWNPSEQGYTDDDLTLTGILDFSNNEKTRQMYDTLINTKQDIDVESKIEKLGDYKIRIIW